MPWASQPVELQRDPFGDVGEVEPVDVACHPHPVLYRWRHAGCRQHPQHPALTVATASVVARTALGQDLAQGERRASSRPGVDPPVAGPQGGEVDDVAAQRIVDHHAEALGPHPAGGIDQGASRRREGDPGEDRDIDGSDVGPAVMGDSG